MSKRLLFNNTTKQIVDTNCPLCNHAQEECQCTVVDKLYIDWADAGRYANATACSTSSSYKSSGAYQYVTVYEFSTTTTNAQLFTDRMTQLGYVEDYNGGTDYYAFYVSADKKTYYYWNYTLNGSVDKTLLNKLLTLDDVYFEQLKQHGKYFEKCDDCGNGINNCTCYNVFEFTVNGSYRTITLDTNRRGDTTDWDGYTDWGDGTKDTNSSHSYSSNGTYIVKTKHGLSGTAGSINSYTRQYLTNVLNINKNMTNMSYMFYNCKALTTLDLSNFDTSNVTNMSYMFNSCSGLTLLNLSNLDTSNVTTMTYMFYNCNGLTTLDVSNLDTSKVTNMQRMFYGCSGLTELDLSNFDTSNVNDMSYMFYNCKALTSLDLSNFDTSNVTNMTYMFCTCSSLTELDVSNFDTSKVTSMYDTFGYCSALTSLDLSTWNVSNVTRMDYMFEEDKSLTSLNLSNWQMQSGCSYSKWLNNCSKLKKANVITTNTNSTLQKAVSSSNLS